VAPTRTVDGVDASRLMGELLRVVSDRTGYPAEMLDLDVNMEADLGIDSIKRVEILGALRQALPPAVGARVQGALETLTRAKTLRGVVDAVTQLALDGEPQTAAGAAAGPERAPAGADAPRTGAAR